MVTKFSEYIIKESVYIDYFKVLYDSAPKELQEIMNSTKGVEQNPYWHSEGDCYVHIRLVTNRLHNCYHDINLDLSGVFHDLGKVETTKWNDEKQSWGAFGHEDVSSKILDDYKDWVFKMGGDYNIVKFVVDNHMRIKYLDDFRTKNKVELISSPFFDYVLKFNSADYGGTGLECKELLDISDVKNEILEFKRKQEENKLVSDKFNGNIVMSIYPELKGVELGKHLIGFKHFIKNKYDMEFNEYVLQNLKDDVIEQFYIYYNSK